MPIFLFVTEKYYSLKINVMAKMKFLQKAINPAHKGYCTPLSKSTCTPRRKALAIRLKKGGDLYHGKKK